MSSRARCEMSPVSVRFPAAIEQKYATDPMCARLVGLARPNRDLEARASHAAIHNEPEGSHQLGVARGTEVDSM